MRFSPFLSLYGLCAMLAVPAVADVPIFVKVSQPQTPITAVLASLAQASRTVILSDDTVTGTINGATLQADNVGAMLTKLQSLDPGLDWRKVYLPKSAPLPTGDALSRQVRALQSISSPGLVVASPTDCLTFSHLLTAAPAPADMRPVYLVTGDAVPAPRQAPAPVAAPVAPAAQADSGMQSVADVFSKMTASEQMQALPQMVQQFQRILQNMDPRVRAALGQQFQQGQGGPNPPQGFGANP